MASHFGVAGDANGTMTRDGFIASMGGVMVGLPLLLWASMGWAMKLRLVNIPNAELLVLRAAPRGHRALRLSPRHVAVRRHDVFMGWMFWLVAAANAGAPAHPALDCAARPPSAWACSWRR